MFIKQLSVFIENREGRLEDVLDILKKSNINIISLSLADTADFGLLRMIVSDPDQARIALTENGMIARVNDVVAVKLVHKVGQLQEILANICKAGLNIEYMYALSTNQDDASIVFKTSDVEKVGDLLEAEGIELITAEEIAKM